MAFPVDLTDEAGRDLAGIIQYLDRNEVPGRAEHVLTRIGTVLASLAENPTRGNYPPELLDLGIKEYREIFWKPYRVVYRVLFDRVVVLLIVDGRRDLQPLLQRRMLTAR